MKKIYSFTQQWKEHFPYQDNIILMPLKPRADSWIFTSQAEGSDSCQGREGKATEGALMKICFSEEQICKGLQGAGRKCQAMTCSSEFQLLETPKIHQSQLTWLLLQQIPAKPSIFTSSPSLCRHQESLGRKKNPFFYVLVKYDLLNVLCQCIKLPTMLIEYLIDIYLLTSYLC